MSNTFKKPSTFSNTPIGTDRDEYAAVLGREEFGRVDMDDVVESSPASLSALLAMCDISILIFGEGSRFFLLDDDGDGLLGGRDGRRNLLGELVGLTRETLSGRTLFRISLSRGVLATVSMTSASPFCKERG